MPFGPYRDFEDCVNKNRDKDNPEAYCGTLERRIKGDGGATIQQVQFQLVPVTVEVEVEVGETEEDKGPDVADETEDLLEEPGSTGEIVDAAAEDFHALLVVEGLWTGDGRYIDEGALTWRTLPLPLMATDRTTEGHTNAVLVGTIDRIERIGREIHGYGSFVATEDPAVLSLQRLITSGDLRGVSVDLDALEYEALLPDNGTEESAPTTDAEGNMVVPVEAVKIRVTSARIMGATVVPFPAFQEAFIESTAALVASLATTTRASGYLETYATYADIDFVPPQAAQDEAERGLEWRREFGRGGTAVGVARARDIANGRALSPSTVNRMLSYFARHEVDKQGQGWSPDEDGYPSAGRIAWALWGGDPGYAWARKVKGQMESRDSRGSIVAGAYPVEAPLLPPAEFFSDPELTGPTPLTVDLNGRVRGHLAVWGQCHVGFADRCVTPPRSLTSYAHFRTGEILCEDGSRFAVGQITLGAGHAHPRANPEQAAAHYDNVASAVADVVAGEDAYGIWVSGALRPGLAPTTIRALMASDVSGDWRRVGGNLELVAILAVNVPGFPKVRVREVEGLVASLTLSAYNADDCADPNEVPDGDPAPLGETEALRRAADRIASTIGRSKADRIAEIRRRVTSEE